MNTQKSVNIDFKKIGKTFREYVRNEALQAGGTIVYVADGRLVEENPKNNKITILIESFNCR